MKIIESLRRKEGEPGPHVTVQPFYLAEKTHLHIPATESAARGFFPQDPSANLIFVIDASLLPAFGYDHFDKWFNLSDGNYFNAYMQHAKTNSDGEENPYTPEQLQLLRENAQLCIKMERFQNPFQASKIFKNAALLMLDRLQADFPNLKIEIERIQARDIVEYRRDYRKSLSEGGAIPDGDFESDIEWEGMLKAVADIMGDELTRMASFLALRDRKYIRFLQKIIDNAAKSRRKTYIFTPREYVNHTLGHNLPADTKRFASLPPLFSQDNPPISLDDLALIRATTGQHPVVTREYAIKFLTHLVFSQASDKLFLGLYYKDLNEQAMRLIESTPVETLEPLIRNATLEELLDFIGTKTVGIPFGTREIEKEELLNKLFTQRIQKDEDESEDQ